LAKACGWNTGASFDLWRYSWRCHTREDRMEI